MNLGKRDIVFMLIILCLAVGWFMAVTSQTTSVAHVKQLYNHLVVQCNEVIDAQQKTDFCYNLPNGVEVCNQNDLNLLLPFNP